MAAFVYATPKGGFLAHIREGGAYKALCGFQPQDKVPAGRQMKSRYGWRAPGLRRQGRLCRHCAAAYQQQTGGKPPTEFLPK